MNLAPRLEHAITKLYNAFHQNTLNPEDCYRCAVGNICDNQDFWKHFTDKHGSDQLNYLGRVHELMGRKYYGYLPSELLKIESTFLEGCGYKKASVQKRSISDRYSKDQLFDGLFSAVALLCALEGIENVMDYSKLFHHEKDIPVYELPF
ncbi:Na(+)-translocating NADH-quinone reductase subunit F [Namhaeicola litoreus]|uniref:Na(+)-translocating NADH-quinone reductase subunit F n=1 Tax=Namhaeicola litoreus TaxID=1052145 RepID=A0ABW3Y0R2_9FLAO